MYVLTVPRVTEEYRSRKFSSISEAIEFAKCFVPPLGSLGSIYEIEEGNYEVPILGSTNQVKYTALITKI